MVARKEPEQINGIETKLRSSNGTGSRFNDLFIAEIISSEEPQGTVDFESISSGYAFIQ